MPFRYLDELNQFPANKFDSKPAAVGNFVPEWTWATCAMDSNLHIRVLNSKLTPELTKYLDLARNEMDYGWLHDIPACNEWTEVDIQQVSRMLIARMTSRVFVGTVASRDADWLNLTIAYAADLFNAAFVLKMFPPWILPAIAPFVPARNRLKQHLHKANSVVAEAAGKRKHSGNEESSDDVLLNWMLDNGSPKEVMLPEMTARLCILGLASIHTTALSVCNVLFDLCAHPEWFTVLRDEINKVKAELGPLGERKDVSCREWFSRLEKLDSFWIESQRLNPTMLIHPQRVAMEPLKLRDGTEIPAGTRVGWANLHHVTDPATMDDPLSFDPMRSYRERHSAPEQANKHLAVQISSKLLTFGYGRHACPGRHFAIDEIKMMLVRFLSEFDFKLPEGKERPKHLYANEMVFLDPSAKIMMKARN